MMNPFVPGYNEFEEARRRQLTAPPMRTRRLRSRTKLKTLIGSIVVASSVGVGIYALNQPRNLPMPPPAMLRTEDGFPVVYVPVALREVYGVKGITDWRGRNGSEHVGEIKIYGEWWQVSHRNAKFHLVSPSNYEYVLHGDESYWGEFDGNYWTDVEVVAQINRR